MTRKIAVIPGDGIGTEVMPEGLRVLEAAAARFGLDLDFESFGWGCDHYLREGRMMPADWKERIGGHDAILFGAALSMIGERGRVVTNWIDSVSGVLFRVVHIITKVAPLGAFGAMAFTIGKYGIASLVPLAKLMGTFYLTSFLFVIVVLGLIAKFTGFSIFRFLAYIKEELLIVLGTSSSEAALPQLMEKMENAGCSKSVVGLVIPTGYSFNLDGTNIYMTMAVLFIAQATNIDLTWGQQLTLLAVAMLTSKGASGVTGAGFITLAATLAVIPTIPVAGMVLILGIDRFMSECRALTNLVGNGVATIVVSAWEKELDRKQLAQAMSKNREPELA